MNKLYIVRHGETEWNVKHLLQGNTDIELNENGISQAKELIDKLDFNKIDIVISSPLKRAKKTAEIIVNGRTNIIYDKLLIERGFGNYEGKEINFDLITTQWDYKLNTNDNEIESLQECLKRAEKFINKINKKYKDKNILIVSHGGFIKALHFNLVGYDENTDFLSFKPDNAVIYEYEINND